MIIIFLAIAFSLLTGVILLIELGWRAGKRTLRRTPKGHRSGTTAVEAAVFGLMGLLIAFTFSGAASRFEMRRSLIIEEANAIETAYLRLDLLPSAAQPELRENFRRYVHSRMRAYRQTSMDAFLAEFHHTQALQNTIWRQAVTASQGVNNPAVMNLVLGTLNEMIDLTTARTAALQAHLPLVVFMLLGITVIASALMVGYGMAAANTRNWFHILCFAFLVSASVFVILELEYPRIGLIRISAFDKAIEQTLGQMGTE
jgi:hypothetical protein